MPQILDLIVVIVEQPAQIQLVIFFGLELNCVALLGTFLPKYHLILTRVVFHCHNVSHVVTEGVDSIVLGRVDRRP